VECRREQIRHAFTSSPSYSIVYNSSLETCEE
jgi:hypothetical protein